MSLIVAATAILLPQDKPAVQAARQFGLANSIDCRNEHELLIGEMTNWRVQKVTLKP